MPRMQHNAPSFGYRVGWRKRGSLYWNRKDIKNPNENQFEVDVDEVYGLYDVQVQAINSHGASFQPVFTVRGRSGEGGEYGTWDRAQSAIVMIIIRLVKDLHLSIIA